MEKTFTNNWLPNCNNKELTISQIQAGIKYGVIKPEQIPIEIRAKIKQNTL